jgi:hypothetical protein
MSEVVIIEQTFPILCKGRSGGGRETLRDPVSVQVRIYQREGENNISSEVKCVHNVGAHDERCGAIKSRGLEVFGPLPICPYSFDLPHALEEN